LSVDIALSQMFSPSFCFVAVLLLICRSSVGQSINQLDLSNQGISGFIASALSSNIYDDLLPIIGKLVYDPSSFSTLNDFPDVYHYSEEKDFIDNALTIVDDNGLAGVVSVALLHRHFQLADNEMLVEIQNVNQSDIKVYNRDDDVSKNALPYMFKVVCDSHSKETFLQPLEFVNFGDNVHAFDELTKDIKAVYSNHVFLSTFYEHLVSRNFTNVFGITLNHRNNLKHANINSRGTTESSDIDHRILTVVPTINMTFGEETDKCVAHCDHCTGHGRRINMTFGEETDKCVAHCDHCTGHGRRENFIKKITAQVAWTSKYKRSNRNDDGAADKCDHYCDHTGCSHPIGCYLHSECGHCSFHDGNKK